MFEIEEEPLLLVEIAPPPPPRPWGFWATVGLTFGVVAMFLIIQTLVVAVWAGAAAMENGGRLPPDFAAGMATNGLLLSIANLTSLPFTIGLIVLFSRLCKPWIARDYLALKPVSIRTVLLWVGGLVSVVLCLQVVEMHVEHESGVEFMRKVRDSAGFLPLLWATFVIQAPVFEEFLFRGFAFRGIERSRLGAAGAILLTSLVWTSMHIQYDAFDMACIFVMGIVLGIARQKTGSLYPPLAMHVVHNSIALGLLQIRG